MKPRKGAVFQPILVPFLAVLLCFIPACRNQAEETLRDALPVIDVAADKEAVNVLLEHFFSACESGDLPALMVVFSEDAVFMPDGERTLDKKSAREHFAPLFEYFEMAVDSSIDEIQVNSSWGFARCSYRLTAAPKSEGEERLYEGKFIFILERQPDMSWRASHFIWNSSTPPD